MNDQRFDAAIRSFAPLNRRRLLRGLVAGMTLAGVPQISRAASPRPQRGGCRGTGKSCKHGGQCCSGVCRHKKCRAAPSQGTCTIEISQCVDPYPASACNGPAGCVCYVTTAGASFCGGIGICANCAIDDDCARIGQPGAVCVHSEGDHCCGGDAATACIQPCPVPAG
ncbi:MAG TPA: hypothetical protein VFX03_09450 [Thermomicrobiales bacterium]|nr:hypothetical protein [Thermomicrobiales bacterium]